MKKERSNQVHLYLVDSVMNEVNKLEEAANDIGNKHITRTDIVTIAVKEFIKVCNGNEDHLKTMLETYLLAWVKGAVNIGSWKNILYSNYKLLFR